MGPAAGAPRSGGTATAHALLDTLARWGVRELFCCPSSTEAAMLDAMIGCDDGELILVTHESVAVAAAEGVARLTGRPSAVYLHSNLGLGYAVAHLGSAVLALAPV